MADQKKKNDSPPDFNALLRSTGVEVVDDITKPSAFSMLLYGLAGQGKTSLAASAAKVEQMQDVLYLDLESGTLPVRDHGDPEHTTIVRIKSWPEFNETFTAIRDAHAAGTLPYKTVVVDTLDVLQEMLRLHKEKEVADNGGSHFKVWEQVYSIPAAVIKWFQGSGLYFVCVTHTNTYALKGEEGLYVGPSFEGQKSNARVPSMFDFVGRMSFEDIEGESVAVLTTRASGTVSKQRTMGFPEMLGNPTMRKIWDLVNGNSQAESDSDN